MLASRYSLTTMSMPHHQRQPLSKLVHIIDRALHERGTDVPLLLVLHDRQQGAKDAIAFAAPLQERARIVAMEAPKGVWYGKQIVGYSWYVGDPDRPAPYSFGVSLSEIELFVLDTLDRRIDGDATLPFLLGIGQGGAMALSAAALQPDRLSGVIAVDAHFPVVPGWEPPMAPLDNLPILLLDRQPAPTEGTKALHGKAIERRLSEWGGSVERRIESPDRDPYGAIVAWMAQHPPRVEAQAEREE